MRQRPIDEAVTVKSSVAQKPLKTAHKRKPDQKELRALPGKIEKLEARIEALQLKVSTPDYYQQDAEVIRDEQQQLQRLESELQDLYRRWEELETG